MRTILKFIKYTILVILSSTLLIFLYFFVSNKIFLGFKDQKNIDYLSKNNVLINHAINDQLFDEKFYNSDVFLLGEIHGYADNQTLDKALFQFLNKKLGVKYYIAEMDSSTANILNNFLSNNPKDEKILKEVVLSIGKRIPQQSSQELYEKWSDLYDYNQLLNDSLKIKVIGIDTDFDYFKSDISRDSSMIVNFKNSVKELGKEKFYGLFGLFHTLQKTPENDDIPFAERLITSGFKTATLVSYTLESEMYLPPNPQFPTPPGEKINWVNADGPFILLKGINDLKALSKPNAITLFKLNSDNSPYSKSQDLLYLKSRLFGDNMIPGKGLFTTDYFQYIFILRNSKALTRLN